MTHLMNPATVVGCVLFIVSAASAAEPTGPLSLSVADESKVILTLPDRTLMGVLMRTADGLQEAAARYSKDNGLTWGDPQTLLKLPREPGTWLGLEALLDRKGEIHLFFLNDSKSGINTSGEGERVLSGELVGKRLDIWYSRSANERTLWPGPRMIWKGYTGALNSVIQMTNGRILLPFSYLTSRSWRKRGSDLDAFTFVGHFDSTLIYSDDDGATWQLASTLRVPSPDIVSAYGAVEPVVLQLKDGRVWMLIRTQMGRFYESFSADGAVWSRPQPTTILSSDSPAGIVRLADGRIVLFWNNCLRFPYAYGGRHVLHAAVSDDDGKTWHGYREVARDPRRSDPPPPGGDFGTAYPFPTVVNDGKIIYCTGQGAGRVLLMRLDPDWLLETTQKADFSARADEWSVFATKGVEFHTAPDKPDAKVLSIRKAHSDWPAAAIWNFPMGSKGTLSLRLLLQPAAGPFLLGLTDHFSVPFDDEDRLHNLFNLAVASDATLTGGVKLEPARWHNLRLTWDCTKRTCQITLNDTKAATLPLLRESPGPSYLRLKSVAEPPQTGALLVESAEVQSAPTAVHP